MPMPCCQKESLSVHRIRNKGLLLLQVIIDRGSARGSGNVSRLKEQLMIVAVGQSGHHEVDEKTSFSNPDYFFLMLMMR